MSKEDIIWSMHQDGADYKEIAKVVGMAKSTVSGLITKLKLKYGGCEQVLQYANHPKPEMPIVEIDGKKYRDITELFLSSEWEGCVKGW